MVLTCFTSDLELTCGENNLTEVHSNSAQECGVSDLMDTMAKGAASPKNTQGREEKELSPSGCNTAAGLTLTFCFPMYSRALQSWHLPEGFVPSLNSCTAASPRAAVRRGTNRFTPAAQLGLEGMHVQIWQVGIAPFKSLLEIGALSFSCLLFYFSLSSCNAHIKMKIFITFYLILIHFHGGAVTKFKLALLGIQSRCCMRVLKVCTVFSLTPPVLFLSNFCNVDLDLTQLASFGM